MKKLTTISLFIFWMVLTAILAASLLSYQNNKDSQNSSASIAGIYNEPGATSTDKLSNAQESNAKTAASTTSKLKLNMAEIIKHNSGTDCWLLIEGKIYDVTSYIAAHPGGARTIIPTCGTDATQAYATKNTGNSHSGNAHALLANYYFGTLNQSINTDISGSVSSSPSTPVSEVAVSDTTNTAIKSATPTVVAPTVPKTNTAGLSLNMTEIAKHNSRSDCWLLISGKVYNVSSYIAAHPGGSGTIIPTCGTDSTQAYATKNGSSPHSGNAHTLLAAYYIGNLNQQTTVQQVQQNVQTTNTVAPTANRDEEWEDD
ncbi:MAG: cytochrome b5 domain-containing protein [Patescibacteria group bacterium]